MTDIRTQRFVVEVSASVMPPLSEEDVRAAVVHAAFEKERLHGMGHLQVQVWEEPAEN